MSVLINTPTTYIDTGFVNVVNNMAALNIVAMPNEVTNSRESLFLGASKDVIIQANEDLKLNMGSSNQIRFLDVNAVDSLVVSTNSTTATLSTVTKDFVLTTANNASHTFTIGSTQLSESNAYQVIQTSKVDGYLIRDDVRVMGVGVFDQSVSVGRNLHCSSNVFAQNYNLYKYNTAGSACNLNNASTTGFAFTINDKDQLELVKYTNFSNNETVTKRIALFGTRQLSSNDSSDTGYAEFNNIGMNAGDGSAIAFRGLAFEEMISSNQLADSTITSVKLASGAVTTSKLSDYAVTNIKMADNSISTTKLQDSSVTENKLGDASVTSSKVGVGAVTESKIGVNAITTSKIFDGSVTETKLATGAVTSAKLATNAVQNAAIANGAVDSSKLATDAVQSAAIASGAVTSAKLAASAVTDAAIADGAVTSAKLASTLSTSNIGIRVANPTVPLDVGGDGNFSGNLTIGGNLIINGSTTNVDTTTLLIEDNIITLNKNQTGTPATFLQSGIEVERGDAQNYLFVFDEASDLFKVGMSNSLQAVATRDDSLTSGYPYYDASQAKLVSKAFASSDLPDGIITNAKLATNAVQTANVVDGAITMTKLSADTVTMLTTAANNAGSGSSVWTMNSDTSNIYYSADSNLSSGAVGVGTNSPQYKLHVNGAIFSSSNIVAFSDIRLKTNLTVIDNALDKTLAINGYTYDRIDADGRMCGVIAQEVQAVLPEVISQDANGMLGVAYGNMVGLLIQAVHELNAKIDDIASKVKSI